MNATHKSMSPLRSDDEAEKFVATSDLSEYDLSGFTPVRFVLDESSTRYAHGARKTPPSDDPARSVARS